MPAESPPRTGAHGERLRVVFMGTPAFSVPTLEALAGRHDVVRVLSQPPRRAGRGQSRRKSPVQTRAEALGIDVATPVSLRDAGVPDALRALAPDVIIVVAYGLLLPPGILHLAPLGALNIHASLLPRWRGAAPIQRAIMAGDDETGISIMQMDEGLDTGAVLCAESTPIGAGDTAGDLHDRLAKMGSRLILDTLGGIRHLVPRPQPDAGATYAAKISKDEARIDWTLPAVAVDRLIRGLSPAPGAWAPINGGRVKLLHSRVIEGTPADAPPGRHLGAFRIACGDGAVEILLAQRPGRRAIAARDMLAGFPLPARLPVPPRPGHCDARPFAP